MEHIKLNRRSALTSILKATAAACFIPAWNESIEAASATCSLTTPDVTEGPYWVDEQLFRSDIRTDPSTGIIQPGIPLTVTITAINSSAGCSPLAGAYIDVWHCGATGIYSDESTYNPGGGTGNVTTTGQKFLRGYQIANSSGQATFNTVYPGWYSGRTIHIHVRIRTYNGSVTLTNYTTQIFFDDTLTNTVLQNAAYARSSNRDTTNATDMVYTSAGSNNASMLATVTQTGAGYAAALTIDLAGTGPVSSTPVIATGGILNAASSAAAIAPGSWVSIYGTNLAASTYTLTSSDLISGYLPTALQGVSVTIDGKPAYLDYLSPGQLNVLVPADANTGTVPVIVSNSFGTSPAATVTLQSILPGLFVQNNYVLAVRVSDGAIVNTATAPVKASDVLEIYGTGFGPTTPSVTPGLVFSVADPTTNTVTVKIGGMAATVLWAGRTAAGLYQINVTVPSGLTAGDYSLVATVGAYSTQSSALLRVGAS